MRVILPDNTVIGYDRLITAILRTDCVPVPISLEFQVILNDDLKAKLIIIKASNSLSGMIQGDRRLEVGAYIAVATGCEKLMTPVKKAIYLENTSVGTAIRASGARAKVVEDIPLLKYFCPFGQTPTYEIARKCVEEGAVVCPVRGKVAVKRLSALIQGKPKLQLNPSDVQFVSNPTAVLHEMPSYITVHRDGSTIEGEIKPGNMAGYYPGVDARRLKNLSTALVVKGTITRGFSPDINAGDEILVGMDSYVILTAAHRFDTGAMSGQTASLSKFWIAQVENI